jgi:hypothetical protein
MSKTIENHLLNVDFINQKDLSINSFNEIFLNLRKKLHIKHTRKTEVDSLLKKAKCKFFQTVHKIMKYCLSNTVNRLPQVFITNITIEYNRNYLEKTIIQIYRDFDLIQNLQILDDKSIKIKNKELFLSFSKYKYYELYNEYLESQCYRRDINKVINKNGKNIGMLYEFVSKNFIIYYMNSKNKIEKIVEPNNNKVSKNYSKKEKKEKKENEKEYITSFEE